jgi:hypothetical protein
MKVTDKGTHTEIELETHAGQQTFISATKNGGDARSWQRDTETAEMAKVIASNNHQAQIFVKCGDVYSKV